MDLGRESEAETSAPPPRRWFQACAALVGVIAVVYLLAPALLIPPVQLIADVDAPEGAELTAFSGGSGAGRPMRRDPLMQECRLTLTATGDKNPRSQGTLVFVADPKWQSGPFVPREQFRPGPGWRRWQLGGRWESTPKAREPATLSWFGIAHEPIILPLTKLPSAGIVTLQVNDEPPRVIDLYAPREEWHIETVFPSPRRDRYVARLPFSCPDIHVKSSQPATLRRVQVIWGEHVLFDRREPVDLGDKAFAIGAGSISGWDIRVRALRGIATCLVRAALANVVTLVLGLPLAWLVLRRLRPIERWAVTWSAGVAAPLVVSITLTHLTFTGRQAFHASLVGLGGASIVLILRSLWRRDGTIQLMRVTRAECRALVAILTLGVCLTPIVFYPLAGFPHWYLGQSYTDTHYYFNSATAFTDHSLSVLRDPEWPRYLPLEHLVTNLLGYTDRSGDFLALTNLSVLLRMGARSAFALLHLSLWLPLPLIGYCLFSRLGCRNRGVWLGTTLLAASAIVPTIFTQDYLAQFLFVNLMLYVLLLLVIHLNESEIGAWTAADHARFVLPLSVMMAACVGIYPSQFLIPAALGLVMLQQALRRRSAEPLIFLAALGMGTALASNVGLLPLLSAGEDAVPFLKALNNIARYVVFPFHGDTSRFTGIAVGMGDWAMHSRFAAALADELGGAAIVMLPLIQGLARLWRIAFLVGAPLTVMGALACWVRSTGGRLIAVNLAVYLAFAALLAMRDQTYPYGKQLITCGALLLVCLVTGIDVAWRSPKRVHRAIVLGFVVVFAALNLRAIWFDGSMYLVSHHHPVLLQARTHVGGVDEDVRELAALTLPALTPGVQATVAVVGEHLPGQENDRDKVVTGHLAQTFANRRIVYNPASTIWLREPPSLALVFHGFELPAEARPARVVLSNPTYTLYAIEPRAATGSAPATGTAPADASTQAP